MVTRHCLRWKCVAVACFATALLGASGSSAQEPIASFVAPPRSIADVTSLLDREQPDPAQIGKMLADADATIPSGLAPDRLFAALEQRAIARVQAGRTREAISDFEQAAVVGKDKIEPSIFARVRLALVINYRHIGDFKTSLDQCVT